MTDRKRNPRLPYLFNVDRPKTITDKVVVKKKKKKTRTDTMAKKKTMLARQQNCATIQPCKTEAIEHRPK